MDAGTKIVNSCALVESIWVQVGALGEALDAMTKSAFSKGEFDNLQAAGPMVQRYGLSESRWCNTAYAICFPMMEKRRRKAVPTAWINYQICVYGDGIPPPRHGALESMGPVVHVSFWNSCLDFDEPALSVKFPTAWDDWEIKDDRLLFWDGENGSPLSQWTFSIRLLDLDSEDALRRCIIDPVKALLAGTPPTSALSAGLPGLISYANEDASESGPRLVAGLFQAR